MGGRSHIAGGQRAALGAAAWHGEEALQPVPLLVCRADHRGGGNLALPGLRRLRQPSRVTAPDVTAAA